MPPARDLIGQSFGRLVVVARAENKRGEAAWRCQCTCGKATTVAGYSLRSGVTKSCGCLQRERASLLIGAAAAIAHANKIKPDDQISYRTAHRRVERARGLASQHPCVDCGGRAQDWSLRHDAPVTHLGNNGGFFCRYSGNPDDYDPRCKACHLAYDRE